MKFLPFSKTIFLIFLSTLFLCVYACKKSASQPPPPPPPPPNPVDTPATYHLVWSDEFDGTSVDASAWNFETGGNGWGNNEKQYYQASNATESNGYLVITAKKETVGSNGYTSARMTTQAKKEFKYGKIEARIALPVGQGLWPAFWMLGANINTINWPACGETDIMERINTDSLVYGTIHWDNNGHVQYGGSTATTPSDFHVYSITWDDTAIRWSVDSVKYKEASTYNSVNSTEEFQKPFFIILNLAVGGNWPGQIIDDSKFPASMYVDYVRVYQK